MGHLPERPRATPKLVIPGAFATVLAVWPANGASQPRWHWATGGDDAAPYLVYETTDPWPLTQNRFILLCDNAKRRADVSVAADKRARRGAPLTIRFFAGDGKVAFSGKISTDNGVYGYARGVPFRPLVRLLGSPGPVTLKINQNAYVLPEQGRAAQLKIFAGSCKLK
jgi:hypothetical protein